MCRCGYNSARPWHMYLYLSVTDEKSAKKAIEDKIIGMVERTPAMYDKVKEP